MTASMITASLARSARQVTRAGLFTSVVIAVLSLTVGAVLATFNLLDVVVLRKLAVPEPERLVHIAGVTRMFPTGEGLSLPAFQMVGQASRTLDAVIGWTRLVTFTVQTDGTASRATVMGVTGNFFSELGAHPAIGRLLLSADEDIPAARVQRVAVVSYPFWQRQLRGNREAIGRSIVVDGRDFVVVGVAPRGFTGVGHVVEPDIAIPVSAFTLFSPQLKTSPFGWVWTAGRLRQRGDVTQAAAELSVIAERIQANAAAAETDTGREELASLALAVRPAATGVEPLFRPEFTQATVAMFVMVSLIMLISCVNVATLVLARTAARLNESRLCIALGRTYRGLLLERLSEAGILSLIAAALGAMFAWLFSSTLAYGVFTSEGLPVDAIDLSPRWSTVACAFVTMVTATGLIGVASASGIRHYAADTGLHAKATTGRLGLVFVGVQVALSVVLLVNAFLLYRSVRALDAVDRGFDPGNLMVGELYPVPGGYDKVDNDSYYRDILDKVSAVPGLRAAAFAQSRPLQSSLPEELVRTRTMQTAGVRSAATSVSPGYFATMGIRVVQGREFGWDDNGSGRRVAIVSETLAARLANTGVLGTSLRIGNHELLQDLEVVGVVADANVAEVRSANRNAVYVPSLQLGEAANWKVLVVNGEEAAAPGIRAAVESSGREFVSSIVALDSVMARETARERLLARTVAGLAGVALVLAAVGLYGLVTLEARRRRKEMALRFAFGAPRRHVVTVQLRPTAIATAIGVMTGVGLTVVEAPLLAAQLFNIAPNDVTSVVAGAGVLLGVAAVASVPPVIGVLMRDSKMVLADE